MPTAEELEGMLGRPRRLTSRLLRPRWAWTAPDPTDPGYHFGAQAFTRRGAHRAMRRVVGRSLATQGRVRRLR